MKDYYHLAKPGIVYGNVLTTVAAFLFASHWHVVPLLFLSTIVGIGMVIASASIFNNYIDRDIDQKMVRTKNRALVTKIIPTQRALILASCLGLLGEVLLYTQVNALTSFIALFGFIFYVIIYGIAKRATVWGTVVGSISGAVPIVVGYTAVTGRLDAAAGILFLILVLWQMPHFYAIAMYRLDDYIAAHIPVLPAVKGIKSTKYHIILYIGAYLIALSLLTIFGYAGYVYLVGVLCFGFVWLLLALQGFRAVTLHEDAAVVDQAWARKLFLMSLIVLLSFSVLVSIAPLMR